MATGRAGAEAVAINGERLTVGRVRDRSVQCPLRDPNGLRGDAPGHALASDGASRDRCRRVAGTAKPLRL